MHAKSWITRKHRVLSIAVLLVILLFSITSPIGSGAEAAETVILDSELTSTASPIQNICMIDGTVQISSQELEAIKSALSSAAQEVNFKGAECFAVVDLRDERPWHIITVVGLVDVKDGSQWTVSTNGVWSDLAIVHFANSTARAAIAGTNGFSNLLTQIPENIFSREAKRVLDPLESSTSPSTSAEVTNILQSYIFPFESGTLVKFFRFHTKYH